MEFTIYNQNTGEIVRNIICPVDLIKNQLQKDEWFIKGIYSSQNFKVISNKIIKKTESEKQDDIFKIRKNCIPILDMSLNDENLNEQVNDFFQNRIDVLQWRLQNYAILRKMAYPPIEDFLDAQVKLQSSDTDIINEGKTQLKAYYDKCLAVKTRFPKDTDNAS